MPAARSRRLVVALLPFLVAAGCLRGPGVSGDVPPPLADVSVATSDDELPSSASPEADAEPQVEVVPEDDGGRPAWLGTRRLDPDDPMPPTPPELVDRRLPPPPGPLPRPEEDGYVAAIQPVPPDVAARSTWEPECPVALEHLRYVTVSHWGFDDQVHTGELIVHKSAAKDLVAVFSRLFEARYPIEELRVISMVDMAAPPTGDGNVSSAFVCRAKASGGSWSEHAYGLALDLNPFHNPYVKGDLLIPQLAEAYLDRASHRPGMIQRGDEVVSAFADIGWKWGGDWKSAKDWMHFSASGF